MARVRKRKPRHSRYTPDTAMYVTIGLDSGQMEALRAWRARLGGIRMTDAQAVWTMVTLALRSEEASPLAFPDGAGQAPCESRPAPRLRLV